MRGIASFIAGFGNGYFKAEDKKYERERQQKLDAQSNELHTARMSEILATQDERQRERDFREANVAALSTGKTDTGQVVTDAAGSNAYTKDADAAVVLQDMAQTANGGAQVAPATRVLTGMQGATQRGTIPGQQVFTDPAKAQEFAQSMPMTEYAKLQARKAVAEQYGKLEIADDMRGKLENLASKGVFKAGSLLDAGNADGALKVLQDMNPDLVPKGAQFKQVDVPDMFDHSKTTKGWALVAPGAEGQPERVLVGDFRDAVFGYLTPQEQFASRRALRTDARDERKTAVAEQQADTAARKLDALLMRGMGGGGSGSGGARGGSESADVPGMPDPMAGFDSKKAYATAAEMAAKESELAGKPATPQQIAARATEIYRSLESEFQTSGVKNLALQGFERSARNIQTPQDLSALYQRGLAGGLTPDDMVAIDRRFAEVARAAKPATGGNQGAAPAAGVRQGAEGSPATPKVLATMGGGVSKSKEQELQEAYQAWQAAKPSWFSQRTPTSEAREREAEARYTELLRSQYQK